MQYHTQLIKHNPAQGQFGDCYRTALACILDMAPEDVPHYADREDWLDLSNKWLKSQGFGNFSVAFKVDSYKDVIRGLGVTNPDIYYILRGASAAGPNHCFIGVNNDIIHDVSGRCELPTGPCKDGLYWLQVLVSIKVCK